MRGLRRLVQLVPFAILGTADAAVTVDLAVTPPQISIWGQKGTQFAESVATADLNGDGWLDLAVTEPFTDAPGDTTGTCLLWGPFALPFAWDRALATPATCLDRTTTFADARLSAADLDADGITDLIIGDPYAAGGRGNVAIFRGRPAWPATLSVADAAWSFRGRDPDDWMSISSTGDLNGDGSIDLVLVASGAAGVSNSRPRSGEAYVILGPALSWPPTTDLAVAQADVTIYGVDGTGDRNPPLTSGDALGGNSWGSGLVAQILGDATFDLILSSGKARGASENLEEAGEIYVLRGRPVWPAVIDLRAPGAADFIAYGPSFRAYLFFPAVADLDGDAVPDLVLGAPGAAHGSGRAQPGVIYAFRGGSLSGTRDLATTFADATIVGANDYAGIGWRLAVGDTNGDGYPDLVTGGPNDSPLGRSGAGVLSVLAGTAAFPRNRDLATDPADLSILGARAFDGVGKQLALGDIDRDGKTDVFFGNNQTGSLDGTRTLGGEAHVVLGRPFNSVCAITPDPGPDVALCGLADVTLDGSRSVTTGCSLTPQYRWLDGATVVRDWASDPTALVRPTATTMYRLEVRCGDPLGPCFETANVVVTVDPGVVPPTLGNSLRAVRAVTDVAMTWAFVADARSFSVFRGVQKDIWPPAPLVEDLPATMLSLPDVPVPPNPPLYFYRCAGASCFGTEGP